MHKASPKTHTMKRRLLVLFLVAQFLSLPLGSLFSFALSAHARTQSLSQSEHSLRLLALELEKSSTYTTDTILGMLSSPQFSVRRSDKSDFSPEENSRLRRGLSIEVGAFPYMRYRMYFYLGEDLIVISPRAASPSSLAYLLSGFFSNLLMLLMGTLLMSRYADTLARPLTTLSQATHRIAQGDFSFDDVAPPHSTCPHTKPVTEIAALTENFNTMVEELRSVEYLRKDFVGNVSHEIKTPVAVISGYARLLQEPDLAEPLRREYIAAIAHESAHLATLSENLLRLTRLENQRSLPSMARYSLDEQLRQSIAMLLPLFEKKQLHIEAVLPPILICQNEELLAQVWTNLLSNAITFTPEGGTITVTASRHDGDVHIAIADTGPGMNEETRARIFERFYQADSSHHSGGSGLGLTLVKRILDLCGAHIQVHSRPGEGSTFTVILPGHVG